MFEKKHRAELVHQEKNPAPKNPPPSTPPVISNGLSLQEQNYSPQVHKGLLT